MKQKELGSRSFLVPRAARGIVWAFLLASCMIGLAGAQGASAQDSPVIEDPHPLRPPETSSPRETLQSFLAHADYAIKAWQQGGTLDARGYRNAVDAVGTMDFSTTSNGDSFTTQIERALLLKELLDRLRLPPAAEIPGKDDVSAHAIKQWTIPDTRITIAQVDSGPRAGEFLFSATTVERLDWFYRLAKDLPYKRTATTPGIYEAYVGSGGGGLSFEESLRNRLRKVDASSPRLTLAGFLESLDQTYAMVKDANAKLKADPPGMTKQEARETEVRAEALLRRAVDLLDTSRLPEAYRDDYALQAALQLKEVFDRTLVPFPEIVPDAAAVDVARKRGGGNTPRSGNGFRWRYPNTEIEIVEVMEGERRGQFLFSADSVRRAGEFYEKVRDLPYRKDRPNESAKYDWPGQSRGVYLDYISSPGYLIAEAHLLGRLVNRLPEWTRTMYREQPLWKWLFLLVCVPAAGAAGVVVSRLTKRLAGRLPSSPASWVMVLAPVLIALAVLEVLEFLDDNINITGKVLHVVVTLGGATVAVLAVWAVFRLSKAIAETIVSTPRIREHGLDASLVRIGMHIVAIVAGGLIIIYSFRQLGADMVPLLAGLGVGGLAVALAAQRTFANFIGSLILFVNKPVTVGDFCRYGDQIGTVEHIGLLATRIRSLERTIVTVPNAEFSEMKIDNFAVRDQRLLKTVLQLRYETTSEQLRYVLAGLRELLLGHPKVTPAPARVRFIGYGAYSKDLEVFAYLDCADQDTFLAIQEDILLRMEDVVNEAGSGFAFPSQTTYFARDTGVDVRRRAAAEAEVKTWRRRAKLPFPEFEADERHELENVLDYPPKGSPDYVPREVVSGRRARSRDSTFTMDDHLDLPALAANLREKQKLAVYLHGRLSEDTRRLLAGYGGGRDMRLKQALVRDLNEIVLGPSIYDEDLFSTVELREQTRELLLHDAQGEDLERLNRSLLEDAFRAALAGPTQAT